MLSYFVVHKLCGCKTRKEKKMQACLINQMYRRYKEPPKMTTDCRMQIVVSVFTACFYGVPCKGNWIETEELIIAALIAFSSTRRLCVGGGSPVRNEHPFCWERCSVKPIFKPALIFSPPFWNVCLVPPYLRCIVLRCYSTWEERTGFLTHTHPWACNETPICFPRSVWGSEFDLEDDGGMRLPALEFTPTGQHSHYTCLAILSAARFIHKS